MLSAISQAWASWKTAPGVALLAIVAFAIGIGSSTAIFTVVNGVLLKPLPYPNSERFVGVYGMQTIAPDTFMSLSVQDAQAFQQQTTSFDAFGWFRMGQYLLTAPGEPQFVAGAAVTPALARQLGPPALGQWFTDNNTVVLSTRLWQRLGRRQDIIGSAITLDNQRYTVVGVMPPRFHLPVSGTAMGGDSEVWIPLDPSPNNPNPGSAAYFAYARRKPGVSLEQAQADARRVAVGIAAKDPTRHPYFTSKVVQLRGDTLLTNLRATLFALLGGAGLLLLIACANVATLLLARSVVRARETAIRVALGASRGQLGMRYFAEGALVSIAGAAAGVGLSVVLVRQMLRAAFDFIPLPDEVTIDWRVLAFSVILAIATGVLAGLAPLWQALRTPPNAVLTEGVRASAAAPARRVSQALVVAEIALAFTLVATSIILVVHLQNLGRVTLGFDPNYLLTFELPLPQSVLRDGKRAAEQARLMDSLRQTTGVQGVTFANQLSSGQGCLGSNILVDEWPPNTPAENICMVLTTPDYLQTLRVPLRSGRFLTRADDDQTELLPVAINETAARTLWPRRSPLGGRGRFAGPKGSPFEVIGVVGDTRNDGLNRPPKAQIYFSANAIPVNPMMVIVRSGLPTDELIRSMRRSIRQVNPILAMRDVATMNDIVGDSLQLERVSSMVMTFFGLAALAMATLGIYGVMSYFVRQRTVELGTRMALGAVNRELVTLVLGGGVKLSLIGVAVGSVALAVSVWLLVRVLDVTDIGWLPFVSSVAVVGLVAGAAASIPAWRTTFLTPMAAMREQSSSLWWSARRRIERLARDVRGSVGHADTTSGVSPADVLTAFVETARGTDSYADALQAVLARVSQELRVESAALLEGRDGSPPAVYQCIVTTGAIDARLAVAADGFLITRLRAYPLPLPFAPTELAGLIEWARLNRPDRLDEIQALVDAGIRMAVPLHTRGEILGVLLLGARQQFEFSADEKQALRAVADQFALMLENARLTGRVVAEETLRRDIALASDVQRRLLPDTAPTVEGAEFAATSLPARRIGGDYYDFVELGDRGIGIALADVSGKGVAAALIMSVVQASLRIIASEGDVPLPRLVARMNEFVYRSTPSSKYATFFYAQLDHARRRLRYVNAGHNPPFLWRVGRGLSASPGGPDKVRPTDGSVAGGSGPADIEELSIGGTVVGMFAEMTYEEGTVELNPGDVLLAYTDGVPEAHNPDNEEFGEERLKELLRATAHLPADDISARLLAAMKDWIRDAEQYDDLTFVVMKVK